MTDEADPSAPNVSELAAPSPRRRRRWAWWIAAAAAVLVLAAAALFVRLLSAPIYTSVGTMRIAEALADAVDPRARASVGVVGIRIAADFRPEVHLRDIRLESPGATTASVDNLAVATSWPTLLGLDMHLERVIVDHVFVESAGNGGADAPLPAIPQLLARVDRDLMRTGLSYFDVDSITAVRRLADGSRIDLLRSAAVTAERNGDRMSARMAGAGEETSWTVLAEAGPGSPPTARLLSLKVEGFEVANVFGLSGSRKAPVSGPVSFDGRLGLSPDGELAEARGQLTVGPLFDPSDTEALYLDRSRLEVRWRPEDRTVVIDPSPFVLADGHGILTGEILAPAEGRTAWPFTLKLVAHRQNTPIAAGELAGQYDPAAGELSIDQFAAKGSGASFAAAMRVNHSADQVVAALSGVFPSMSVDALKTLWPSVISPQARNWVRQHVSSGEIVDATVDVAASGTGVGQAGAHAALSFRFENLAFSPVDDGPPIREAFGTGTLVGDRFEVVLERGLVDLGEGRSLSLGSGRFVIPTVVPDPPNGEVTISLSGSARDAVALWERLPLSKDVDLPAKAEDVSGEASAEITLALPLIKDVPASLVTYGGNILFKDLGFAKPIEGRTVQDGDITIALSGGEAAISGTASVDGVKAAVDITRPLQGGEGRSAVRLVLGDADRAKLGFNVGGVLSGPVSVTLEDRPADGGESVQVVTADLSKAAVRVPAVGFSKAKGKPGEVRFTLRKAEGRTVLEDIVFDAGGALAEGRLVLDGDGTVLSGAFPRVRLTARDRLSVRLSRSEGLLKVDVTGDRFDARNLIRQQLKRAEETGSVPPPLEIDVEIGSVTGWGDEALTGFNMAARVVEGRTTALSMTTQTAGGGAASATITPAGAVRRIEIEAGEVGRLMRFLDLYARIYGGRARITGVIEPSGVVSASVDGSRLKIVDEPALARLSTAVKDGPAGGFATADIRRMLFDLRFGLGVLQIEDGIVRADTAGLSIQGDVDFRRDTLRLSGTYLPASALDSLIGKIPILGQTLFAGGRAGLFGVTFRLTGPIDDPALSVNPLSVIAPGIFRKLFELG